MELLALILGYLLAWPVIAGFLVVAIWMEAVENRLSSTFLLLGAAALSYVYFDVRAAQLIYIIPIYIVIGFIWSFWRFYRYVNKIVEFYNDNRNKWVNEKKRLDLEYDTNPRNNVGRIAGWVVNWPVSCVGSFLGDLINLLETAIKEWFVKIYDKISGNALAKVKAEDDKAS